MEEKLTLGAVAPFPLRQALALVPTNAGAAMPGRVIQFEQKTFFH